MSRVVKLGKIGKRRMKKNPTVRRSLITLSGKRSKNVYAYGDAKGLTRADLVAAARKLAERHREPINVQRVAVAEVMPRKMLANPAPRELSSEHNPEWFPNVKSAEHWLIVHGFERGPAKGEWRSDSAQVFLRRDVDGIRARWLLSARENPAPREAIQRAARRFARFTGERARSVEKIPFPENPGAGLAVGPVLMLGYSAVRDGKRQNYLHKFTERARPMLVASHDGRALYMLGGNYKFTERGIVDAARKPR